MHRSLLPVVVAALVWSFWPACALAQQNAGYFPPSTADTPAAGQWNNPFCDASAVMVAWNAGISQPTSNPTDSFALYVWGHAKTDYAARLTLIGDGSAYAVELPRIAVRSASTDPVAYLVTVPDYLRHVEYFVDGVGVDGAAMSDCPSYVKMVEPQTGADVAGFPRSPVRIAARPLQAIPPPACGELYRGLQSKKDFEPLVGFYGNRELVARVEVFVDSSGRVVKTRLWQSSGVEGIDDAALSAAQWTTYEPAQFMCTPVVSSAIIGVHYKP